MLYVPKMEFQTVELTSGRKAGVNDEYSYDLTQLTINCIPRSSSNYYKFQIRAILRTRNEIVLETEGTQKQII